MVITKKEKIIVIVLDGATFDILDPMIKNNMLPNLAKIIKKGVKGRLNSTFPPVTPVAWASFITGKNPGKHGIMDFVIKQKENNERTIVNATNIKSETLWSILSKANKRVGIIHVPLLTHPPEKVNGFIISGHPFLPSVSTYPPQLKEEIFEKIPGYKKIYTDIRLRNYIQGTDDSYLKSIHYALKEVAKITLYMMEKPEWDLLITQFFFGDPVQHVFWKDSDPEHPFYDQTRAKKYGKTILNYYREIDMIIGKILRKIEKSSTVIVMSDHGFGPIYKEVYVNQWLRKIGLLKLKEKSNEKANIFSKLGINQEWITSLLEKNPFLRSLQEAIPLKLIRIVHKRLPANDDATLEDIDYSQTKAYSYGSAGQIFINLKGRDPEGIVDPEEYEELRDYIIDELSKLKDPESGKKIVDHVFKKEDIYFGPHLKSAADLFFIMQDFSYITPFSISIDKECRAETDSLTGTPKPSFITGWHRMDGILIMAGPQLRKSCKIRNARIIDLAPTILHIANVPIPSDMDGRVLMEIFNPETRLPNKKISYQILESRQKDEHCATEKEKEAILQRLRALGYLK